MTITLTLTGHLTDLGAGMLVRRMLPAAQRQAVGPFVFFDHFGPIVQTPDMNTDVRPHPHIGLATVTYLWEGVMMHRDSLGSVQRIEPGAINWMTAGRGIVHSERAPEDLRASDRPMHGLQLWVALPKEHEESSPRFAHTAASEIPQIEVEGAQVRVLVGQAWGAESPVATLVPTLYLDVALAPGQGLTLPPLAPEMAIYTVDQALQVDGAHLALNTLAVLDGVSHLSNEGRGEARFVVVGGAPLDGPRFIWWNFVSSERGRIARAAQDWDARLFKAVPDDDERIELPTQRPF
ncbi:MAG: pirin family protein [Burkholderiales bacterium]|nr:pirin family protein [Burkholderiales bacterium]